MRRMLITATMALLALLVGTMPAQAGVTWCRADPIFSVNGKIAHVYVSTYHENLNKAMAPTRVKITVPAGASTKLLYMDNGFGYGYDVTFHQSRSLSVTSSGTQVKVEVYVPATKRQPVIVEFLPASLGYVTLKRNGTTNGWVTFTAVIP